MGAGIMIIKYNNQIPLFLGLLAKYKQIQKHGGQYDLPKGTPERGESAWQTAQRECYEETGYVVNKNELIAGPYTENGLTMWACVVPRDTQIVLPINPESGKYEHEGYDWLEFNELCNNCFGYLKPFVEWAHKNL